MYYQQHLEELTKQIAAIDFVLSGFFLYDIEHPGIISFQVLDASKEEKYQHMTMLMDMRRELAKKKEAVEILING